jgi:hypothetical protein
MTLDAGGKPKGGSQRGQTEPVRCRIDNQCLTHYPRPVHCIGGLCGGSRYLLRHRTALRAALAAAMGAEVVTTTPAQARANPA